ncbi:MAG: PilZ domain-containing protein [Thiogranum sp.]|nr:PilZ domain-containing protein [Thiogranum sp.]
MEHRCDTRMDIQKRVLIHVKGNTYVSGVTRDISYGGLRLGSAQVQNLKKNALVRASFKTGRKLVILQSQVVRVDEDDTAALMFIDETPQRTWSVNAVQEEAGRDKSGQATAL